MIYKYTKCESVIAKIMADLNSTEAQQRTSDIREWIFEAVEKIGAPVQYIQKESGIDNCPVFKIEDCQIPIPDDLVTLDGVAYSINGENGWVPVNKATSIFHKGKKQNTQDEYIDCDQQNPTLYEQPHEEFKEKPITTLSQVYTQNLNKYYEKHPIHDRVHQPEYFIKPGWLVINRPLGFVKLAYKAIATDERGYPLIPDTPSYQEAVYWYVTMKLTFPKFMSGKLGGRGVNSAQNIYMYTEAQWHKYKNLAYNEALTPTADDMRNIKRNWNRLVLDYNADDHFFKHINDPETIYNDYYYGY